MAGASVMTTSQVQLAVSGVYSACLWHPWLRVMLWLKGKRASGWWLLTLLRAGISSTCKQGSGFWAACISCCE